MLMNRSTFVEADDMKREHVLSRPEKSIDLNELRNDAQLSTRLCSCEGTTQISNAPINECQICGHTSCSNCSGNPRHQYLPSAKSIESRLDPSIFESKWRSQLPARLGFWQFPGDRHLGDRIEQTLSLFQLEFLDVVEKADLQSRRFCLRAFKRVQKGWVITYESSQATLELHLDVEAHWLVYLHCPPEQPGNSVLRKHLAQPLARASCGSSLFVVKWEVRIPTDPVCQLQITSTKESTSSWRSDLGLVDYKNEKMPLCLVVEGNTEDAQILVGKYYLHKSCGTAMNSLYKRVGPDIVPLYMFLDPDLIGLSDGDSFVFTNDCSRPQWGRARQTIGQLDSRYNPCGLPSNHTSEVSLNISGIWVHETILLRESVAQLTIMMPTPEALTRISGKSCSETLIIIEVQTEEILDIREFCQYAWALERVKTFPPFSEWQPVKKTSWASLSCPCSPVHPRILWSVDDEVSATPREDREATSHYERQMKLRGKVFKIEPTQLSENPFNTSSGTSIKIGINIASLCHRTKGKLESILPQGAHSRDIECKWRLQTDHCTSFAERFPSFILQSNPKGSSRREDRGLEHDLFPEQQKSLEWMRVQESGVGFNVSEIEEAIQSELRWRVEAKAEATVTVHGGILADLPSFGKTITTIALIASDYKTAAFDPGLLRHRRLASANITHRTNPSLTKLAATLVVCPPQIAEQWKEEMEAWLRVSNKYNIMLLMEFSDLCDKSLADFQRADVVIASWNVFDELDYIQQLARFSGMTLPAVIHGRGFDTWVDFVTQEMPAQVCNFQNAPDAFKANTENILRERLESEEFKDSLPLKIGHGSQYQPLGFKPKAKPGEWCSELR